MSTVLGAFRARPLVRREMSARAARITLGPRWQLSRAQNDWPWRHSTRGPARRPVMPASSTAASGGHHSPSSTAASIIDLQASTPAGACFAWTSGLSEMADLQAAVSEAVQTALELWPSADKSGQQTAPGLAFVFVSSFHQRRYEELLPLLREAVPSLKHVVGSSGYGVIGLGPEGKSVEVESAPVLSIALASLPGVKVRTFAIPTAGALPDADAPPESWYQLTGVRPSSTLTAVPAAAAAAEAEAREGGTHVGAMDEPGQQQADQQQQAEEPQNHDSFVILADPAFSGLQDLLSGLDFAFPSAPKVGGLASAGGGGFNRRALWRWSEGELNINMQGVVNSGAVGLAMQGPLVMEPMIAQGCRPLDPGQILTARQVHQHIILEVSDSRGRRMSPLQALQQQLAGLPPAEREAAAQNLLCSLAADDFKPEGELGPGDFLVRPLVGADPSSGALAVGQVVRVGQRLRFVERSRLGAVDDLVSHCLDFKRRQLSASLAGAPVPPPLGLLAFTCNGRGVGLFQQPHFESRKLTEYIPVAPAGFFCNGEIGPVGGVTHLHGFTCAAAILRPATRQQPAAPQVEQGTASEEGQQQPDAAAD